MRGQGLIQCDRLKDADWHLLNLRLVKLRHMRIHHLVRSLKYHRRLLLLGKQLNRRRSSLIVAREVLGMMVVMMLVLVMVSVELLLLLCHLRI